MVILWCSGVSSQFESVMMWQSHVEAGGDLTSAHAVDVASLLKQFFRELPEPLLTCGLYDVFLQCVGDGTPSCLDAVLLACLLLPATNLATLRYLVTFLLRVASVSQQNRMDSSNLAVCLAPNLLYCDHVSPVTATLTDSQRLEAETMVIQLLIENAGRVGMVSDSICERASLFNCCFTSLSANTSGVRDSGKAAVKKWKKRRSGSLQGAIHIIFVTYSHWYQLSLCQHVRTAGYVGVLLQILSISIIYVSF